MVPRIGGSFVSADFRNELSRDIPVRIDDFSENILVVSGADGRSPTECSYRTDPDGHAY